MNNLFPARSAVFCSVLCAAPLCAPAASMPFPTTGQPQTVQAGDLTQQTNRIIVKLKNQTEEEKRQPLSVDRAQALSARAGVMLQPSRLLSTGARLLHLPEMLPLERAREIANKLSEDPDVAYAEPDYRRFALAVPNDTRYGEQWNLREDNGGINIETAWDFFPPASVGSANVTVAVLDTGIAQHADLAGRIAAGYDFISDDVDANGNLTGSFATANDGNGRDSDPQDPGDWITAAEAGKGAFSDCTRAQNSSWHGTHVAGIIGATSNNRLGIAGINWNSPIVPVRVLGKCGGFISDIADGARWAAGQHVNGVADNTHPAQVINSSLGGSGQCSNSEQQAINDALGNGVKAYVVAAGNEGQDAVGNSPANCAGVISVAATDRNGNLASYSNFGATVTISAPGGDGNDGILSTSNAGAQGPAASPAGDAYTEVRGTSEAAPHVAGVVSLMLSVNPALSGGQVMDILKSTARAFPSGSNCPLKRCGAGIVDAAAAVAAAQPGASYLSLSRTPVAFNPQSLEVKSDAQRVNVNNPSTSGSLSVGQPAVSGPHASDFPSSSNCEGATLGPGQSCFVDVSFQPSNQGGRRATLSIPSNARVPTAFVELSGTGTAPATGSTGGGGCSAGQHASFDPALPLLLAAGLARIAHRWTASA